MRTTVEPETNPLGPKKTILVIATVVGCIGILWPKVFHPMLIGSNSNPAIDPILPPGLLKDRGPGCCGVVLDTEVYMNSTVVSGDYKRYRDSFHILVKDQSIRQERPLHMRPDPVMHPAMKERGFPAGPTHTRTVIDGRPGPIPGMRPPMGGGAFQQAPPKGSNSMGLIMPLYTLGIIAFFVYTIMKIVCKKPAQDPAFKTIVSGSAAQPKKEIEEIVEEKIKRPENGSSSKLECRSSERGEEHSRTTVHSERRFTEERSSAINAPQIDSVEHGDDDDKNYLDIEELKRKLEETESAMTKIIARMSRIVPKSQKTKTKEKGVADADNKDDQQTVKILGMELTSTYEGGQKWDPANRLVPSSNKSNPEDLIETVTPQEIYLEGTLPHESQILVSDAEERVEEEPNEEDGESPAIILSSKMTLSLISLDHDDKTSSHGKRDQAAKGSAKELVETICAKETLNRGM